MVFIEDNFYYNLIDTTFTILSGKLVDEFISTLLSI